MHLHFGVTFCALVGQAGFGAGTLTEPVPVRLTLVQLRADAVTVIVAVIVLPLSAFFTLYLMVQVAVLPGLMVAGRQDGSLDTVPLIEYVNFTWLNVVLPVFLTVKTYVIVEPLWLSVALLSVSVAGAGAAAVLPADAPILVTTALGAAAACAGVDIDITDRNRVANEAATTVMRFTARRDRIPCNMINLLSLVKR